MLSGSCRVIVPFGQFFGEYIIASEACYIIFRKENIIPCVSAEYHYKKKKADSRSLPFVMFRSVYFFTANSSRFFSSSAISSSIIEAGSSAVSIIAERNGATSAGS